MTFETLLLQEYLSNKSVPVKYLRIVVVDRRISFDFRYKITALTVAEIFLV